MKTVMFVERPEKRDSFCIDYQLYKYNFYRVPEGLIRIARFEISFCPYKNMGYYGDIYMRQFIRKWKKITKENIQRRNDKLMAKERLEKKMSFDMYTKIVEYI